MKSIGYRIIRFLLLSILVINVVSGYYIYHDTQEEIEEIFNAQQAQVARIIEQLIVDSVILQGDSTVVTQVPDYSESEVQVSLGHHYEKKIAYQVWSLQGRLLLMSENAPLHPLSATAPGFSRTEYGGDTWYIFSLYSDTSRTWIFTAQNAEARNELIELITCDQLVTMLVVSILILFVVIVGVMQGIRPIALLGQELTCRDGNNLRAIDIPLSKELLPIKNGVNRLLERIEKAINQERSFSADLSHELRTPLASIKVHAQNLELKESLSKDAQRSVTRMNIGIDNMTSTIEQLLLLNRIENHHHELLVEVFDLIDVAREVVSLLPIDIHKKNDIALVGGSVFVKGSRSLIGILLRNLIDNAVKYSDRGSTIVVKTEQSASAAIIEVIDNGPGMTDEQKNNSIKRYYRVSDSQGYGSGIGLSIAKKIIDIHSGELVFLDKEKGLGLIARVSFARVESV